MPVPKLSLRLAILTTLLHAPLAAHAAADTSPLASPGAANTSNEELARQLQVLQETLAEQQRLLAQQAAEIERLRKQVEGSAGADAKVEEQARAAKLAAQDAPKITMNGPRPTITSADGRNSFAPRVIVHMDAADYREDREGPVAIDFRRGSVGGAGNREINSARDFSDGAYFRRARLGFEGQIARDFNYRLMLELAGAGTEGPTRINDAWIAYSGWAPFTIQLGAFSPPANMDDGTSVDSLAFIERASPAELSRALGGGDGRLGLGVRGAGQRWMSSITLTNRAVNDAEVFDAQLAVVSRFGASLLTSADYNLHAGVNGTWVFEPADQGSSATGARTPARFRERPEIRVDSTRLIDTGSIDADAAHVAGLEFGANWRNFYVQAEHFWYGVERPEAAPFDDPDFAGYYLQGSWLITGESRRYDPATGAFQAPRPFVPVTSSGGLGAWELALRYSHADLNHPAGVAGLIAPPDAVRGGEQSIWSLGLNWTLNPNVRLLFNYLRIDVDRLNPASLATPQPFGAPPATPTVGAQIGQELDVFALRSQFSF